MKPFLIRSHNIKSKALPTWPTPNDKTPETVIYDEKNGYAFVIRFGPNPEISVWDKSDRHNLGDEIHSFKLENKGLSLNDFYKLAAKIRKLNASL